MKPASVKDSFPSFMKAAVLYLMKVTCWNLLHKKALTYRIQEDTLENLLTRLLENDVREEFAVKIEHAIDVYAMFFDRLSEASTEIVGSSRKVDPLANGFAKWQGKRAFYRCLSISETSLCLELRPIH